MAYTKTNWKGREGINLDKYSKFDETAKSVVLINMPDSITVQGTQFSPENMNKIEQGVADTHELAAAEARARSAAIQDVLLQLREYHAAGNDYSRVLIKTGIWTLETALS